MHFGQSGTALDAGDIKLQHTLLVGPGQDIDIQLLNFDSLNAAD